jgi:hypothetical protein
VLAERGDEVLDAALQEVVAQVHDERVVAEEGLGGEDAWARPSGASCSM